LNVTPGLVDVTANPSNLNPAYVSLSSDSVSVAAGVISSDVNFVLPQGGRISGYVTRDGVNPLPRIAVAAIDGYGYSRDQQVSDINGRFTTADITTGYYQVTPAIDSLEISSPSYIGVTIGAGATVSAGTFTISGALGTIQGSVTSGGKAITTGALIVVTTGTVSAAGPPALSSMTLTGAPYYSTASLEDGTYSIDVRQSTYSIYGWYAVMSSTGGVFLSSQTLNNVWVQAGATVAGKNLTW
jgi:hypothetical protein